MNEEKNNFSEFKAEDKSETEEKQPETEQVKKKKKRMRIKYMECCNFGRLLIGIFIIFAGLVLLATSLNLLPGSLLTGLFHFWPLLIVAFGLSLLDPKSDFAFMSGIVVLAIVLIMFAVYLRGSFSKSNKGIRVPKVPSQVTNGFVMNAIPAYASWEER